MNFRTAELINIALFAFYIILAVARPLDTFRRVRILIVSIAGIFFVALMPSLNAVLRDWTPALLILLAYFNAGNFFTGADSRSQALLVDLDRRVCGEGRVYSSPFLEMCYMLCYAVVPAGLTLLYWIGRKDYADNFWTIVLVPTYLCYAALPFFQTSPPRIINAEECSGRIHSANLWLLGRVGVGANTVPSGHATASLAVALAFIGVSGPGAIAFGLVAVGIGLGAVSGGYHYRIDILAGWVLAIAGYVVLS
jgi:membrane-associated phospholipid phosphatase